jgi:lipopolysaccharide transport system ATP-binding protein
MGSISVSKVGKAYRQYPTRWSRVAEWLFPWRRPYHTQKWVLEDISFTVQPGEAIGVVGLNGAGKSTLLKIITGTVQPTTGAVHLQGRVAALLELGMGFHPDFTGRQNVIMAGQLLGYAPDEIVRLMPDIEAFAEIGDYIDQPVRVYSSGMQMRLAFSVATAIRPDILIVDEALSVGDTYFQHKSFARIREYRELGTTLLIVSHSKDAIQAVCDRAVLLKGGKLVMEGTPETVMDYYNAMLAENGNKEQTVRQVEHETGKLQTISGTGEAVVADIALVDNKGQRLEVIDVGQPVRLVIEVQSHADLDKLVLGYGIRDRLGQVIYGTNTHLKGKVLSRVKAGSRIRYEFSFPANFGPGTYSVQTALADREVHTANNYEWRDLALVFNVVNLSKPPFVGVAWIDPEINVSTL